MAGSPGINRMPAKVSSELTPTKYLVVTGGTVSGLGKGTTISSIGVVLKDAGLKVTCIKIDPYLNVDAGTMSPYEHGEVFVLEDGGEVDLDLGNYERFLDVKLTRDHNITTGKIFERVIRFEREGKYLGKTVQFVPHVTNAVQVWIQEVSRRPVDGSGLPPDICLIEVGGTVGDIESGVYLEALQQFGSHVGQDNFCLCHVSFVPVLGSVGEQKTKPTQHSVKELRMAGLKPDFIFCRSDNLVSPSAKAKIALFGQVNVANVISVHDVNNVYHVPQMIASQGFVSLICNKLKLTPLPASSSCGWLRVWTFLATRVDRSKDDVTIGVVGKYTGLVDSYLSVIKALRHAAIEMGVGLNVTFVESSDLEEEVAQRLPDRYERAWTTLKAADGVLCPGGFGDRGILGKAASARYCRQSNKPYLGICLGMQTAVIDLCRELNFTNANSEEFDEQSEHKVVIYMPEIDTSSMGGNMRLGIRNTTVIDKESLIYQLYDHETIIKERHRHRYEVNPQYVPAMEAAGLKFVGADGDRMEIAELKGHPYFLCTQFHPEFTSRPLHPNPCFLGFLLASKGRLTDRLQANGGKLLAGGVYKSQSFFSIDNDLVKSNPTAEGDLACINTLDGQNNMQDDKENGGLC